MAGITTETAYMLSKIDFSADPIYRGLYTIFVNNGEGSIAHFHLESEDKKTDICVCIYSSEYFDNNGHRRQLTSEQKYILDNWLREPEPDEVFTLSRWSILEMVWYCVNPQYNNSKFRPPVAQRIQPDYTKLKSFRSN